MQSLFVVLAAGLEAGLLDSKYLRDWSERLIGRTTCPQDWLTRLTLSASEDEARAVLFQSLRESGEAQDEQYDELLLGFLFMAYERRLITPEKFVLELIDISDAHDLALFTPEDVLIPASAELDVSNVNPDVLSAVKRLGEECVPLFQALQDARFYERMKRYLEYELR